tara:strand:+ start:865 stop:1044 length:180 start_codon:yes stop_codon:yes gene_type:complete
MQEKKSSFQCKPNRKKQRNTRMGNEMDYKLFGMEIGGKTNREHQPQERSDSAKNTKGDY